MCCHKLCSCILSNIYNYLTCAGIYREQSNKLQRQRQHHVYEIKCLHYLLKASNLSTLIKSVWSRTTRIIYVLRLKFMHLFKPTLLIISDSHYQNQLLLICNVFMLDAYDQVCVRNRACTQYSTPRSLILHRDSLSILYVYTPTVFRITDYQIKTHTTRFKTNVSIIKELFLRCYKLGLYSTNSFSCLIILTSFCKSY